MERDAQSVGKALVQVERDLDRLLADRSVTPGTLSEVLAKAGALQATLRGVHLHAHVAQTQILTPGQATRYAELRGYAGERQVSSRQPSGESAAGHQAQGQQMPGQQAPGQPAPGHGSGHKH